MFYVPTSTSFQGHGWPWLSPFCLPPAMIHTPILQLPQPGAIQALSQGCEAGGWLTLGKAKSPADSGAWKHGRTSCPGPGSSPLYQESCLLGERKESQVWRVLSLGWSRRSLPAALLDCICNEENGRMKEPMNFPSPWKQLSGTGELPVFCQSCFK